MVSPGMSGRAGSVLNSRISASWMSSPAGASVGSMVAVMVPLRFGRLLGAGGGDLDPGPGDGGGRPRFGDSLRLRVGRGCRRPGGQGEQAAGDQRGRGQQEGDLD